VALHAEAEGKWGRRWGPTRRANEEEEEGGPNTPWHVGEREAQPRWSRAARRAGAGERGSSTCGPRWGWLCWAGCHGPISMNNAYF
jgi:hypothetical protein